MSGRRFNKAFAHTHNQGWSTGHICYSRRGLYAGFWSEEYPTPTLLHEVAHALRPRANHSKLWKSTYWGLMKEWEYNEDTIRLITSKSYAITSEHTSALDQVLEMKGLRPETRRAQTRAKAPAPVWENGPLQGQPRLF